MSYRKKSKTRYTKTRPKKAHVVIALAGGVLEDVHVIVDRKKAKKKRDELAKRYGLEGEEYTQSPHGKDCRWSDLDEETKSTFTKSTLNRLPHSDKMRRLIGKC
jgi:hypothetical protein